MVGDGIYGSNTKGMKALMMPTGKMRCMCAGTTLVLSCVGVAARAQTVALDKLAHVRMRTGVDTMLRCIQPRGGAPGRCGNAYLRTIERRRDGTYELRNDYFDSTGKHQTTQTTRATPTLALRSYRVQDVRDSAAMVIADGVAAAWVSTPRGTRLVGMDNVSDRYESELIEQALATVDSRVGTFITFPVGSLYGPDPVGVTPDTIRITTRTQMRVGQSRVQVLVMVRSNGNMAWLETKTGKLIARRGSAGPNTFWWHIRQGAELPQE